jgi:hypothetical protein
MCPISIHSLDGSPIHSVDDWFRLAPPKGKSKQWRDGRSAKETAKAWFRTGKPEVPEELEALFESHPATKGLVIETAIPEVPIPLDNFRGETRNSDMILLGHVGEVTTLVGIESKADEPFGELVGEYRQKAKPRSKIPERIDMLCQSIFGHPVDEEIGQLRYQLLHGVGGTLIEARNRKAGQALFVVHEFISDEVALDKVERNAADFERFVRTFPGLKPTSAEPGILLGSLKIPGGRFVPGDVPLFVGKAAVDVREKTI